MQQGKFLLILYTRGNLWHKLGNWGSAKRDYPLHLEIYGKIDTNNQKRVEYGTLCDAEVLLVTDNSL